jgi:O-antigen/teichoic acid export membrane protein
MSRLRGANPRNGYFAATLLQQLLTAGAASVALLGVSAVSASLPAAAGYMTVLVTLAVVTPFWLLREFARRTCYVELNQLRPILLDGVAASVQLGLLCVLWMRGEVSAHSALAAAGVGHASASLIWWTAFRPKLALQPSMFRRAGGLNWRFGRWACLGRATEMLHAYSLHWLLAIASGPAATGAYAAASSLLALANPILMGIGNLLAPETARAYAAGGNAALRRVVIRSTCLVTLVTAAYVVLLAVGAEPLLSFTFGQVHEKQAAVVIILSLGMLVGITSFGADNGLRALARPGENFKAALAGLAVSFLVAATLVGQWGATGAALGALAGNLSSSLVRIESFLRMVRVRVATATSLALRAG